MYEMNVCGKDIKIRVIGINSIRRTRPIFEIRGHFTSDAVGMVSFSSIKDSYEVFIIDVIIFCGKVANLMLLE